MFANALLLAAAAATASALMVHTHTAAPQCVDLQCPSIALDLGEQSLSNEETFSKEQCESCAQCTNHGYSVCLRLAGAPRSPSARRCSCAHSTPANCHNEVLPHAQRPVNITMSLFSICYLSAIQSPPRPLAVTEKNSVIVTVEAFWAEPYWKSLELENLTLHYEFEVQSPEHCDGELRTSEQTFGSPVHTCSAHVAIAMSGGEVAAAGKKDDDYEHSEGYDAYDDELPPEVQFDREVFHFAENVKFFYRVSVKRPRQLSKEHPSDPFRDVTTQVDSEPLRYALRTYPKNDQKKPASGGEMKEDSEEEFPEETDFFAGDKKADEARKKAKDQAEAAAKAHAQATSAPHHRHDETDEKDKSVSTSDHAEVVKEEEKEEESTTAATNEKEEKEEEKDSEEWQEVHPTSEEVITEDLIVEQSGNATDSSSTPAASTEESKEEEEEKEEEGTTSADVTTEPSESAEVEKEIEKSAEEKEEEEKKVEEEEKKEEEKEEKSEEEDSAEATTTVDDESKEEKEEEGEGGETTSAAPADDDADVEKEETAGMGLLKKVLAYFNPNEMWGFTRIIVTVTVSVCLLIFLLACCCKRDVLCGEPATKSAGGYTYNAAGQQPQTRPLVVEPTREPLNQ